MRNVFGEAGRSAVALVHEHQLLEQAHVLFVLEQRAHERRDGDLVVRALQGREGNVFRHQQLEPVDQLAGGGLLLEAGQVAYVVEGLHRRGEQFALERGEVHGHDLAHGVRVGEADVVEEAAAQEGVGQLLLVVGGDEDQRAVLRPDELARLVAVELHAVEFAQQVVGEFDVGLVDLVDQQCHGLVGGEGLPEHALHDVVADVLHALAALGVAQLAVAQPAHGVVFVEALLGLGGGLDVPLQQRQPQGARHLLGQQGLAGARLALDQQRALQGDGGVHRELEIRRGDITFGALEFHGRACGR